MKNSFYEKCRIKSVHSWTEYEPIWQVQNAHNSNRKECLAVLKFILDKTDPDTIFAAADTDQSGELSFEELDAAYGKVVTIRFYSYTSIPFQFTSPAY